MRGLIFVTAETLSLSILFLVIRVVLRWRFSFVSAFLAALRIHSPPIYTPPLYTMFHSEVFVSTKRHMCNYCTIIFGKIRMHRIVLRTIHSK
jgi:hypothetical protein